MDKQTASKLKRTFIVPVGLAIILIPFSIFVGWNLLTLVMFWFVLTPALAIYLPTFFSGNKNHRLESVTGLIIFYAIMVLMIYDHYKTDYFQVMIVSCVFNVILVSMMTWTRRPKTQKQ